APVDLNPSRQQFTAVLLYDQTSGTYEDVTAACASSAVGDVFHSSSGALISRVADALYLGMDSPFHYSRVALSTAGVGGAVDWQYWDGASWVSVSPDNGAYHLTAGLHELLLWPDLQSTPADWQKTAVNGDSRYWVRVRVSGDFITAPVGSQLTALPDTGAVITEG
ncbi:MAG TPA: hypothetical protein VLB27_08335, partial [candidate division Zixibacteria bacterium]|nr:hypothetical protein [candidate division Zixibacteria bacterium]